MAPKSGEENRKAAAKKFGEVKDMVQSGEMKEKIENVFGDLSDESVRLYTNVRDGVMDKIEEVKHMTVEDYANLVEEVVEKVKQGSKMGAEQVKKLKDQFIKDYPDVKEQVDKKAGEVKKKLLAEKK